MPPLQTRTVVRAAVYPFGMRLLAAVLFAISRASLPVILGLLLLGVVDIPPPRLVRLVLYFGFLPGLAAALLRRVFTVRIETGDDRLVLLRRGEPIELDRTSVERIAPWRMPLPGPGLSLRSAMHQGRRYEIQTDDPAALLRALGEDAAAQPSVAFAQARHSVGKPGWRRRLVKYGLFPLLPAFIFFRLHQYIMFGGLLGQYRLYGLRPYLSTWVFHWVMTVVYLVLYAATVRLLAEGVAFLVAHVAPARALPARRWCERAASILYYAGVPALIALRFLA
jgi:hypothetical protein